MPPKLEAKANVPNKYNIAERTNNGALIWQVNSGVFACIGPGVSSIVVNAKTTPKAAAISALPIQRRSVLFTKPKTTLSARRVPKLRDVAIMAPTATRQAAGIRSDVMLMPARLTDSNLTDKLCRVPNLLHQQRLHCPAMACSMRPVNNEIIICHSIEVCARPAPPGPNAMS